MFYGLPSLLGQAFVERLTLALNHLLRAEPAASARLAPHAGRSIRLNFVGWPAALPALPLLAFRITPAGLLEWCGDAAPAQPDLVLTIEAVNPALGVFRLFAGVRPRVEVAGDAALAADVDWLFDNLRWDVQDDLERFVGPAAAREIGRVGAGIAAALSAAARRIDAFANPSPPPVPPQPARR